MKKQDSWEIAAILMRLPGWEKTSKREVIPMYGRQRLYVRSAPKEESADNRDNFSGTFL